MKKLQSIIFASLVFFGVAVAVILNAANPDPNVSGVRDAQKTNTNSGGNAVFKTQNNRDGTVTLYVVIATPMPTATATPTPTATATATTP